ncbi:unnamed protein product [Orchesella dallaii]|uniref:Exonuclease domain-containing protein n=1 Tax=Orchesella dallaii TaxID=48710 RepID=A0ABP1PLF1_9HEXA
MEVKDLPECSKIQPPPPGPKTYSNASAVNSVLQVTKQMTVDDRFQLTSELIKSFAGDAERQKKLMNLARDGMAKSKTLSQSQSNVLDLACLKAESTEVCGQLRNVDPGASCPNPSVPASQVPFICRGDLIANCEVMFIDTEKVTVAKTHDNMSGDFAIVNEKGQLLFWCFINHRNVCKYNTQLTGLTEAKLKMGLDIQLVQTMLSRILPGKTIYGAAINNDIKSLGFDPAKMPFNVKLMDVQDFYRDSAGQPISLAQLSEHFIGCSMHENKHSSIADARFTAICYHKMIKFQRAGMTRFSCPVMDEMRKNPKNNPRNRSQMTFDRCTCGVIAANPKGKKSKKKNPKAFSNLMTEFSMDDWL